MKRVLVIFVLLIAVSTGILYIGISSQQSFAKSALVACTNDGALRMLSTPGNNKQVWPGERLNDSSYRFEQLEYTTGAALINSNPLSISYAEKKYPAQLLVEETTPDSSRFIIQTAVILPSNPIQRIKQYFALKQLQQQVDALLKSLKKKFDGEELVYGLKIEMNRVTDSAMISTRTLLNHYPTVTEVYNMVDAIHTYIAANGGTVSNPPMLHVYEEGPGQFLVMVAVPTKTIIPGNETFLQKRMLANGYILVSEVTGGTAAIQKGEAAMKQYVMDHQKSSPAIPFQMLLTDRRTETDTSKWKTRLYYPVMY